MMDRTTLIQHLNNKCWKQDLNLRSILQEVLSLSPLTTRVFQRYFFNSFLTQTTILCPITNITKYTASSTAKAANKYLSETHSVFPKTVVQTSIVATQYTNYALYFNLFFNRIPDNIIMFTIVN